MTHSACLAGTVNSTSNPAEAAQRQEELSQAMNRLLNALQAQAKDGQFDIYVSGRWLRFSDMDFDSRRQRNACPEGAILINNTCGEAVVSFVVRLSGRL